MAGRLYMRSPWYRCARLSVIASLALCWATASVASEQVVRLGEVRALAKGTPEDLETFRSVVSQAVSALDVPVHNRNRYVLSATLVEFSSVQTEYSNTTTCRVTAALRESQGGSLRALLKGNVRMHESERRTRQGDAYTMRIAVDKALSRLGEAIE